MRSLVLVIIPIDAPDPVGMLEQIVEPFRQDHNNGKSAWPYWDYWSFFNISEGSFAKYVRDCAIPVSQIPTGTLFAALYTPDGTMHDCNCPMPAQPYDDSAVRSDFDRLCLPIFAEYNDHMGLPISLHT